MAPPVGRGFGQMEIAWGTPPRHHPSVESGHRGRLRDIQRDLASADLWPVLSPPGELLARLARSKPAWHAAAACREHPELEWVPSPKANTSAHKAVCAACLVRAECLDHALEGNERGVWGGTDERDRRAMREVA